METPEMTSLENENSQLREMFNKLSIELSALKSVRNTTDDKILAGGFDHPCRQTCSGWQQGFDRGQFDLKDKIEEHEVYKLALESIQRNGDPSSMHTATTALDMRK